MNVEGLTIYHVKSHLQVHIWFFILLNRACWWRVCWYFNLMLFTYTRSFNFRSIELPDTNLSHQKVYKVYCSYTRFCYQVFFFLCVASLPASVLRKMFYFNLKAKIQLFLYLKVQKFIYFPLVQWASVECFFSCYSCYIWTIFDTHRNSFQISSKYKSKNVNLWMISSSVPAETSEKKTSSIEEMKSLDLKTWVISLASSFWHNSYCSHL
jgi:hypothetical protein